MVPLARWMPEILAALPNGRSVGYKHTTMTLLSAPTTIPWAADSGWRTIGTFESEQ